MKLILSIFSLLFTLWLATGFVLWNWNPQEWSEGARFFLVTISLGLIIPLIGFEIERRNNDT